MFAEAAFPAYPRTSRALQQHLFSLLRSCGASRGLPQIHAQIVVNGYTSSNFVLVQLLARYVGCGLFADASKAFQGARNSSTSVWNQMIRGHGRSPAPRGSVECFNRMVRGDAEPDGYTYSHLLSACVRSGLFGEGLQVHGRVLRDGYVSNPFVKTNLVNLYAMGGGDSGMKDACKAFDDMGERNLVCWNSLLAGYVRRRDMGGARKLFDEMRGTNVVSWTIMVAGYARNGMCRQALSVFNEMRRLRVELDQVALVAALSACSELGNLKLGRWIHSYVFEKICAKNQQLSVTLNNAIIHMYASCGSIDDAYEVFRKMPRRSTASWTTMIIGFAKQGLADEALGIFHMMLSIGEPEAQPDELTYIGALTACSHAGYVDEGRHIFKSMSASWGIKPRIEHYGCMVDLLSRAGNLEEACRLIETMPMKPNEAVWGALLGGCRIHKNPEIASVVAQRLEVELNPDGSAGYLLLLLETYRTAKRWMDANNIRQKMIDTGTKKPAPGRSWVEVNGVIHDFVAGDISHTHTFFIHEMLRKVKVQAESGGCQPDEALCVAA
ncbi:pentatricopeptide repeat-containing protein At5g56310-like [Rhodamnia argentea]|uniref:Pentatricopeptide repeat-containing protein At5g56310-like n=1 Tax=Rhodamnia argentea TaxID=178133 RepID=A0A8B8PKI2_9MYRT|nr:pentatricopeptide repeat-containing protein At5g56310-like [Rhodamnia argentea]